MHSCKAFFLTPADMGTPSLAASVTSALDPLQSLAGLPVATHNHHASGLFKNAF
jgi:hypothetical protein